MNCVSWSRLEFVRARISKVTYTSSRRSTLLTTSLSNRQLSNARTNPTPFTANEAILKKRAPGSTPHAFINSKRLVVQAGHGGDGCIAFARLFCNPKAGPSGGDGGNGGHIVLKACNSVSDLSHLPSIVRAHSGIRGTSGNCHGANGVHTYLPVPSGTCVFEAFVDALDEGAHQSDSVEQYKPLSTMSTDNSLFIAARGGSGGKGNAFLTGAVTATASLRLPSERNTPLRIAECGAQGERRTLLLRLSRLADLGLIGAPNAGKSTLLRRLTRARPKVAPYAFTTLKPHMGVLKMPSEQQIDEHMDAVPSECCRVTIADLPGLIAGAAERNAGLGVQFLNLIADCRLLAYVVDIGTVWREVCSHQTNTDYRMSLLQDELTNQLATLQHELAAFDTRLADPDRCLVVGSKLDLILSDADKDVKDSAHLLVQLKHTVWSAAKAAGVLNDDPTTMTDRVVLISARRGDNVTSLMRLILEETNQSEEID